MLSVGGNRISRGNLTYSEKTRSSGSLFTIKPTWADLGAAVEYRLSYGTALVGKKKRLCNPRAMPIISNELETLERNNWRLIKQLLLGLSL
jgi:hypothetical protein